MKKRTALCLAVTALMCVGVILVVWFTQFEPGVSKANFNRIHAGMAKAEVHAILGRPYLDVEVVGDKNEDVEKVWEYWKADKSIQMVVGFVDERVAEKTWYAEDSLLDKVRRWLGFS